MTAVVATMGLALLAALVVISVFSSPEHPGDDDRTGDRPGSVPDEEKTSLKDLLDP
jgi:hypothetical protein